MREIKFRAKDKETGKWHYGGTSPYYGDRPFTIMCLHIFWKFVERGHFDIQTLGEYTGRKDKQGVEIYEGDITNHGVVEWCECLNWDSGGSNHPGFYFRDKYHYGERGDLHYHTGFDDNIKVIGNIYENLEWPTTNS